MSDKSITKVELVVVMPVGPNCLRDSIMDTMQSLLYYITPDHKIILADDSGCGTGALIRKEFPDIDVVVIPTAMGKLCGLYITLSLAFRHVLERYHFDALLRLDTDALVTGPNPEAEAISLFRDQPRIGMAGQYPFDYAGKLWDSSWPKEQMLKYTTTYKFFKHIGAHFMLAALHEQAKRHGYVTGESVFGGACFFSERCLRLLQTKNLLPRYGLKKVNLEEDHLFSLLVKAVGLDLGDLASGGGVVACAWKGLPAAPEELWETGKKIVHSTRFWKGITEMDIRNYFKAKRTPVSKKTPEQEAIVNLP